MIAICGLKMKLGQDDQKVRPQIVGYQKNLLRLIDSLIFIFISK